jgi:ribosomal protein S18 acetylase RimI-like enzyme
VVRLAESGPTWDLGEAVGDLESLAVAAHARGRGVGTGLIEAARELLRERGVRYWSVTVAAANAGAIRLYEREGFQPQLQHLLERL